MHKIIIVLLALATSGAVQAEFYSWQGDDNKRHVSNIPPQGFNQKGQIKSTHNPHAIDYQYERMLQRLRHEQLLEQQKAEQKRMQAMKDAEATTPPARRPLSPKEGTLNLRSLIDLEKRGGRPEK